MTPLERADVSRVDHGLRLSRGVWIAAAAEIAVALGVGTLILRTGQTTDASGNGSSSMADMHASLSPQFLWHPGILIAAGTTAAMLIWWSASRARIAAILAAAGLVGLSASETVRTMAAQSHLVAMAALEALLVAAPLLLVAALQRNQPTTGSRHSRSWTAWVIIAVALNSGLLIALHLPTVHSRAAQLGVVPLWLTLLVVVVGLSYWGAILITGGRVRLALRRGALIIGQEVAGILGLAALLRPFSHMQHTNPLGLSTIMDQRLGGILMLVTCAAVTLPIAKHLERRQL